ncbi:MAG: hypothetical protein KGY65_07000 [Candidatus Thermoplasmatota archaeon]|nr:hypothetical protein [Candidatus Thermoplasmatota archaeon]MBS3802479.1 hypothetical protein [Candidatus Thermoplasmatota archaeon]
MKKIMLSLLFLFLLLNINTTAILTDDSLSEHQSFTFSFSSPEINMNNDEIQIFIKEASSSITDPGYPSLPKYTKTIILPQASKISSVTIKDIIFSLHSLNATISLSPFPQCYDKQLVEEMNESLFSSYQLTESWNDTWYPNQWLSYNTGSGLINESLVTFLTFTIHPVRYNACNQTIRSLESITITVDYEPGQNPKSTQVQNPIDLIVIGPESFSNAVQPLIMHKKQIGISAGYKTTQSIYSSYNGQDQAEKIKYFIEDMVSNNATKYVLIMGSIYQVPIRTSNTSIFGRWDHSVLSDLYYADLYMADGSFSSWDTNNDGIYGETDVDDVDLYPDVYVGRLACDSVEDVSVVVDKIMVYEQNTFGQEWYQNMIFIGGNTFPGIIFQRKNEGEEHNKLIMSIMDDFTPSAVIWTSKHNFNLFTINHAINKGAGFIDYSGHGFEHGMGTYRPHGRFLRTYITPYINGLKNEYKLPVIFFDACLTAKLDFIFQDILDYKQYRLFDIAFRLANVNTSIKLSSFAWSFVKYNRGGAIATIGATRTAFGGKDFGCEKLSTEFFSSYERGQKLGPMFAQAQNTYIHDLPNDEFTVEEFVLLGDPSLQLGGHSDDIEPPSISIVNPVEDAIHYKGIPLFPRLIMMNETRVIGGFKRKPVQIAVEDNVDDMEDINVYVHVDHKIDEKLTYNKWNKYFETSWTGFGWNQFTMNITAVDRSGNQNILSTDVVYHCLFR